MRFASARCITSGWMLADQPPNPTNAMVGYFKTGSPSFVGVQAAGNVPLPSPTPTPTASPTPTATSTPTPTPIPCAGLTIIQVGGSIVPGTTDIGNHGDDQVTPLALPFPFTLYGQTFTSINLSSNGSAQFMTTDTAFTNVCLPWTTHDYTIFPYWDDQRTDGKQRVLGFPWWQLRCLHVGIWHCAQPHLQYRMAHCLFRCSDYHG